MQYRFNTELLMSSDEVILAWEWCCIKFKYKNLYSSYWKQTWSYESTKEPDHILQVGERIKYIWKFVDKEDLDLFLENIHEIKKNL